MSLATVSRTIGRTSIQFAVASCMAAGRANAQSYYPYPTQQAPAHYPTQQAPAYPRSPPIMAQRPAIVAQSQQPTVGGWYDAAAAAQADNQRWLDARNREYQAWLRATGIINTQGWAPLDQRVQFVKQQLVEFSGQSYVVVPSQTYQWGQAQPGGVIALDVSSAVQELPVLAFRLAHEWAHQVHGDPYNPSRPRLSPTQDEDMADAYAGYFLCRYRYPIQPVIQALTQLSNAQTTHSGGLARAATVRRACEQAFR